MSKIAYNSIFWGLNCILVTNWGIKRAIIIGTSTDLGDFCWLHIQNTWDFQDFLVSVLFCQIFQGFTVENQFLGQIFGGSRDLENYYFFKKKKKNASLCFTKNKKNCVLCLLCTIISSKWRSNYAKVLLNKFFSTYQILLLYLSLFYWRIKKSRFKKCYLVSLQGKDWNLFARDSFWY